MRGDDIGGDGAEIEALAARDDGGKDFIGLGGGEDEFDVWGWFLEGFEESVEGTSGQHVHLVNVDDAKTAAGRGEANGL